MKPFNYTMERIPDIPGKPIDISKLSFLSKGLSQVSEDPVTSGLQKMIEGLIHQQDKTVYDTLVKEWGYQNSPEELFRPSRFPNICRVSDDRGNQLFFFNDGTPDGRFIIGFTKFEHEYKDNTVTISYRIIKTISQ